jgi:hypothetical protein
MVVLRLRKLGSYDGQGIKATAGNPLVQVDDEIARKLLATGYFSVEGPGPEEVPELTGDQAPREEMAEAAEEETSEPDPPATKKKRR